MSRSQMGRVQQMSLINLVIDRLSPTACVADLRQTERSSYTKSAAADMLV